MADITYCTNAECPMRDKCKRADVPHSGERVSYALFEFKQQTFDTTIMTTCKDMLRK